MDEDDGRSDGRNDGDTGPKDYKPTENATNSQAPWEAGVSAWMTARNNPYTRILGQASAQSR